MACRPGYNEAYNNLGSILKDQGRLDEVLDSFRAALRCSPTHTAAHSNLLLTLQYRGEVTLASLAAAHAQYQQQHAAPLHAEWEEHRNSRQPDRPLRVGFLSADLRCHPVGYFLFAFWKIWTAPSARHSVITTAAATTGLHRAAKRPRTAGEM